MPIISQFNDMMSMVGTIGLVRKKLGSQLVKFAKASISDEMILYKPVPSQPNYTIFSLLLETSMHWLKLFNVHIDNIEYKFVF
jgi:hypothetical protein